MKSLKSILVSLCILIVSHGFSQKLKVILDSDTGNEVDDLYALAYALTEDSWDVVAINAAHWQTSHWAIENTMENSHRLNQKLLSHMGMSIPTKRGGAARMYDWGDRAQHSAAAYGIIEEAKKMKGGEKLNIIALGALTNVASAVYIDPSIESRIRLYWLGTNYDFENDIMTTTDFNCMMDIYALHSLFKSGVEMHVMPHDVALEMKFNYKETENQLRDKGPLGKWLCDRWYFHLDGLTKDRWIWDLAIVSALIHPEWTSKKSIATSRDLGARTVTYYTSLEGQKVIADFYERLQTYMEKK